MPTVSVTLLIVSGVAGVILTVWGRVMPPDTSRTKTWFVAIGAVSVVCIVGAGVLNGVTQNRLNATIQTMAGDVRKLAGPADAGKNASVDQILAAAASKLIQQDKEISQLKGDVHGITHPSNAFYQGDSVVAVAQGKANQTGNQVIFQLVIAGENGLDFNQTYRFQNADMKCEQPIESGKIGSFGVSNTQYPNLRCTIASR